MNETARKQIGNGTVKGRLISALLASVEGTRPFALLNLSGAVSDQETFTLGDDVFEIHQINTDTGADVSGGELATDTSVDEFTVGTAAISSILVGHVLRIGSEYMRVLSRNATAGTVKVKRGYAGSTAATHANGADIFEAAQAVDGNNAPVPVGATLTAAAADDLIKAAVDAYYAIKGGDVEAIIESAGNLLIHFPSNDEGTVSVAETLANGTLAAPMGSQEVATLTRGEAQRVPTAAEVTAGKMHFVFPFDVKHVSALVYTSATGADVAQDGSLIVNGKMVTLDNSGATDFATTDTVVVEARG